MRLITKFSHKFSAIFCIFFRIFARQAKIILKELGVERRSSTEASRVSFRIELGQRELRYAEVLLNIRNLNFKIILEKRKKVERC